MFKSYSMELGGRTLTLEFGKYAEQASGSCFVRYGDTCVLTTCTAVSYTHLDVYKRQAFLRLPRYVVLPGDPGADFL